MCVHKLQLLQAVVVVIEGDGWVEEGFIQKNLVLKQIKRSTHVECWSYRHQRRNLGW